jgi:hypothetical protein
MPRELNVRYWPRAASALYVIWKNLHGPRSGGFIEVQVSPVIAAPFGRKQHRPSTGLEKSVKSAIG